MKKKLIISILAIVVLFTITGCGKSDNDTSNKSTNDSTEEKTTKEDNEELVKDLNDHISKLREEWDNNKSVSYLAIYKIQEVFEDKYTFLALCEDEFKEIPNITKFAYNKDLIPNYDGYCMYDTVELQHERNKDRKLHTVVLVKATNEYYDVYITFNTFKMNDKTYTYPTFKNSKLLK